MGYALKQKKREYEEAVLKGEKNSWEVDALLRDIQKLEGEETFQESAVFESAAPGHWVLGVYATKGAEGWIVGKADDPIAGWFTHGTMRETATAQPGGSVAMLPRLESHGPPHFRRIVSPADAPLSVAKWIDDCAAECLKYVMEKDGEG